MKRTYKDKEFCLEKIKTSRRNSDELKRVIRSIPAEFFSDREFVLKAVAIEGSILPQTPFTADKEVVMKAVSSDPFIIAKASKALHEDREVVLEALRWNQLDFVTDDDGYGGRIQSRAGHIYVYGLPKSDEDTTYMAAYSAATLAKCAGESLRTDRDFVLEAVKMNGLYLLHFDNRFLKDREVALAAIHENWHVFFEIDGSIKDKGFILDAVKENPTVLTIVPNKYTKEREIALTAVAIDGLALKQVDDCFADDEEIVMTAIENNPLAFRCASARLKNDRDVALAAISRDVSVFASAGEVIKDDKDIVLDVVKQDGKLIKYVSDRLKRDREVIVAAVKQNKEALKAVPDAFWLNLLGIDDE